MKRRVLAQTLGVLISLLAGAAGASAVGAEDVLAWIPYARMVPEYANVVAVLGFRPMETQTTDPDDLGSVLQGKSVLLIPEQLEADGATLEALGLAVANVLSAFLEGGGLIVGMTYARGADDILRGAGLWQVDDGYNVTGGTLAIPSPDDPLAAGVPAAFEGPDSSTDLLDLPEEATVVVWDASDRAPVVFRWTTRGGTVTMLGFDFFTYNQASAQLLANAVGVPLALTFDPPAGPEEILRSVDSAMIEDLLVDFGLTFDRRTDAYGDPLWVLYWEETTVVLLVDKASPGQPGRYQTLILYAFWRVDGEVSCGLLNAWNGSARETRAFLNADGEPALQADLLIGGGVGRDTLVQFLKRFERSAIEFERYLLGG